MTIHNCLDCGHVEVKFAKTDNVHVIVYHVVKDLPKEIPAVTPVGQAILLLCTLTYPDGDSLAREPNLHVGTGSVSMTFEMLPLNPGGAAQKPPEVVVDEPDSDLDMEPCTSRQALERLKRRQERKAMRAAAAKRAPTSSDIQVTVQRRFDIFTVQGGVFVQVNGGETEEMTMADFHKKFFVRCTQHSFNFLRQLHEKCAGNWLQVIQCDDDAYSRIK